MRSFPLCREEALKTKGGGGIVAVSGTIFHWVWVLVTTVITVLNPNRVCNQDLSHLKSFVCVDRFFQLYVMSL